MHLREGDASEERQRGGVIFLCFAGKARDEIRRERAAGEIPAQPLRDGGEGGGVLLAVHAREGAVRAALEGEMEMIADLPRRGDRAAEVLRDDGGLQ